MVQKRFLVVVASAVAFLMMTAVMSRAQASDPWIGTWKQNIEKSTFIARTEADRTGRREA